MADRLRLDAVLLFLFFSLCCNFGYATLNKYDPRNTGVKDSNAYFEMAEFGTTKVSPPYRFRILTPAVAGFVNSVVKRLPLQSWNSLSLSFLLTNSLFVALTCLVTMRLSRFVASPEAGGTSLVAALLYVTSFNVVNLNLAGLVDAGEAFSLALVTYLVYRKKYSYLPIVVFASAFVRETAAVFCTAYIFVCALFLFRTRKAWRGLALAGAASLVLGAISILTIRHLIVGPPFFELHQLSLARFAGMPSKISNLFIDQRLVYGFALLAVLALPRILKIDRMLLWASGLNGLLAILLSLYCGNELGRPFFLAISLPLVYSSALFLTEFTASGSAQRAEQP